MLGHWDIVDTSGDGDKVRGAGRRAATSQYSRTHFIFTAVDVDLSASFLQRLTMTIAIALMLGARDHFLIFVSQDWAVDGVSWCPLSCPTPHILICTIGDLMGPQINK